MDAYDLRARHGAVFLVVLPLVIVWLFFSPVSLNLTENAFIGAAITALYALLAAVARERGLKAQSKLVAKWGALPTTAMLRHRDPTINSRIKERYHRGLEQLGFDMPTADEEGLLPSDADARYENAISEIRRRAKADELRLVQEENISFGFVRNLFGLKPLVPIVSTVALAGFCGLLLVRGSGLELSMGDYVVLAIVLGHAALLHVLVREELVKAHADAYARALLAEIPRYTGL